MTTLRTPLQERLVSAVGGLSGDVIEFLQAGNFRMVAKHTVNDAPVLFRFNAARRIDEPATGD